MWRTLFVCALLLLPSLHVRAADAPNETVIRMTVLPMAAPKPALKYQLLPELREMNPGNPIHEYTRCFAEQYNFWRNKEVIEEREKWQKMPLEDLPLQEIRQLGFSRRSRRSPLRYADDAARLDTPDWQILLRLKRDGVGTLLPGLQGLRDLAGALKVRFRAEVAERRFEDALGTAKTMFALSRHLGEHPTLIGELIGTAVASLALEPLDELIQQPGCPNLFWALTDLPQPFVNLRKGVQSERMMTDVFALIDEQAPMSDAQVQTAVDRLQRLIQDLHLTKDVPTSLKELSSDESHVRATRQRLVEAGLAEKKVKQFSTQQVILVEEKLEFKVRRDEGRKAMNLPYWQAMPILAAAPSLHKREHQLFSWWEGTYDKVKLAQARLDQRIALLRCVEALRIYAAEHDGKLPEKLDDIRLPLPVDPATGKSFSYKIESKKAHLLGEPLPPFRVRYEVTIGK